MNYEELRDLINFLEDEAKLEYKHTPFMNQAIQDEDEKATIEYNNKITKIENHLITLAKIYEVMNDK